MHHIGGEHAHDRNPEQHQDHPARARPAAAPRPARRATSSAPATHDWDEARLAWNLAVDQRPAAVALPESAEDVAAVVAFARTEGLRVAPQGTGHNAAALEDLSDTILLKTHRMRGVTIDPDTRTARAEAGVIWIEVVEAAAEHGLAALAGSSPDVGVVGYTLGGGLSWLARKHGIGANQVTAIEVVTASGDLVRTDWANEPDLFWALRGGGGSFAIVTAIEFNLFPISEVYAGILWYPVEEAAEVLKAWRSWTEDLPDEMTSVGRILQFPPIPEIPEPVRGKSFVVVEAIWLGEPAEGDRLLEPLRALGPVMDTMAEMPIEGLSHLHMDPEEPVPGAGDGGMLNEVDDELIDRFVSGSSVRRSSARRSATSAEPWHGARLSTGRSTPSTRPTSCSRSVWPRRRSWWRSSRRSSPTSGRRSSPGRPTTRT